MGTRSDNFDPDTASGYRLIWFVILITLAIGAIIYSRIDGRLFDRMSMTMTDISATPLKLINGTSRMAKTTWTNVGLFLDRQNQIERLKSENQILRQWKEKAERLERENADLRKLNNLKLPSRRRISTARVIGGTHGPFLRSAIINAGSDDDILDGSAVLDSQGVVGRVIGIGQQTARVLFLTDPSSRVPIRVSTGAKAILAGDGSATPLLTLIHALGQDTPSVGDEIFTSGQGGVFKAGLPVGRIVSTNEHETRVELAADYSHLNLLRIINPMTTTKIENPGIIAENSDAPDDS